MEQLVAALFFLAWWDVGFSFFFFAIGASSFREGREEKDWKKKGDKEQNNTIRMLLDFFFLLKYACFRGEERVQFHRIPHEISRGSTRF